MYKNIVFKGGGSKIFFSAGAVCELIQNNIIDEIERVAGTSAGSVLALAVSLRLTPQQIEDLLLDFDLGSEIKDQSISLETERFFTEYGRYSGEKMLEQIEDLLQATTGKSDVTFEQMHKMGFRDLYIVAADITNKKQVVFSWEDTPNEKVSDAVRASCSYPLYFVPVKGKDGEILVDGGLINNYPIDIFDDKKYLPDSGLDYNPETLGIFLGEPDESGAILSKFEDVVNLAGPFDGMDPKLIEAFLENLDYQNFDHGDQIKDIISYMNAVFQLGHHAPYHTHHPDGEIFLNLDFVDSRGKQINTFDLDLPPSIRLEVMQNGIDQTTDWVNQNYHLVG